MQLRVEKKERQQRQDGNLSANDLFDILVVMPQTLKVIS